MKDSVQVLSSGRMCALSCRAPPGAPLAAGLGCIPLIFSASLTPAHLSLQTKPVDPTVDGGAQVQQAVNIECVSDFTEAPVLNIQFRWVSGQDSTRL